MDCRFHISQLFTCLLCATIFIMSGCKKFDEPAQDSATAQAANIAIADLHAMLGDRKVIIDQDIIIGGYVTSSDKASNFHRTFMIEDASGGAEIMAGLYDLHNIYPEGYYIAANLNGCAIGEQLGVMQIGMPAASYSYYPTDYFASRAVIDKYIKRYNLRRDIAPLPLTIEELTPSHCGRLVNIGRLTATEQGIWSGYQIFTNDSGQNIAVYTSEYADYAQKTLPSGRVSITGILQYGKVEGEEYYIIKMRDEKDCNSDN